ncbi:MAG: twin-arginine translocase TatA/TatE family subunit [Gammaproteobacteria bacterium]|jgi:sec-independent protein translocase protein TatA
MGFGVTELLILLLIVALLFGTKKLRNMGGDLGSAVKSFRSAVTDADKEELDNAADKPVEGKIIEGQVEPANEEAEKS